MSNEQAANDTSTGASGEPDLPLLPNEPRLANYPWFVTRMATDVWIFGLLLTTGTVAGITRITNIGVHRDIVWIDVELAGKIDVSFEHLDLDFERLCFAPTSRCAASIRADAIVAAFELAEG